MYCFAYFVFFIGNFLAFLYIITNRVNLDYDSNSNVIIFLLCSTAFITITLISRCICIIKSKKEYIELEVYYPAPRGVV